MATWRFEIEPTGTGCVLRQSAQMGPGPSGLTPAIEARPDKEELIIERRLDEWRANMRATVDGIKHLAEQFALMRTAVMLSAEAAPWHQLVDYVVEAERLGVDMAWVAEAWGSDAVGPLGFLARARTRDALGLRRDAGGCALGGDDGTERDHVVEHVGRPFRARSRHVGPTGDRRVARRSLRPSPRSGSGDTRRDRRRSRRRTARLRR